LTEEAARISNKANRPLLIDAGENIHEISCLGLTQAAVAAKALKCVYLWLDLFCINQRFDSYEVLQIKNMSKIYGNATEVRVMSGGIVAVQAPDKPSTWIYRAWTFQEASLRFAPRVLTQWKHRGSFSSVTKPEGDIAIV